MKIIRFIVLVFLILSFPIFFLSLWWYFLNGKYIFPNEIIIATIAGIFAILVFVVAWFLLNKKAKIFASICGSILIIFLYIFLYFGNYFFWKISDEPNQNNKNISINSDYDFFEHLFPISESVLEYDMSEILESKYISQEKWEKMWKNLDSLDEYLNYFKKYTIEIFLEKNHNDFPVLQAIKVVSKQKNTERDIRPIQEAKKQDFSREKIFIFNPEYMENYEKFLEDMEIITREYNGKIYVEGYDTQKGRLEVVRILWNHIILASIYENPKYLDKTIEILEKILEKNKQKYLIHSEPGLSSLSMHMLLDERVLDAIEISLLSGQSPEKFSNLKKILLENNREYEFKNLAFQHEYFYTKNIYLRSFEDIQGREILWAFDEVELFEALRHFYVEAIRRNMGDLTLPQTIFSHIEDYNDYIFGEISEKYLSNDTVFEKISLSQRKNFVSRGLFFVVIPNATWYWRHIERLKQQKISILEKIP